MRSKLISAALSIIMATSGGCSVFMPWNEHVTINSNDPTAKIMLDNKEVGTGHVELDLPRNHSYSVVAVSNGKVATKAIGTQVSITGALDIVGGVFFIVPLIGCLTPGFFSLTDTDIKLEIPADPPGTPAMSQYYRDHYYNK